MSAGGYMVPRVACEMGDVVAAVADVIATARAAQLRTCDGGRPVPFLLLAGTTDPVNPYAGQRGDELTGLASAPETLAFFVRRNGCTAREETPLPHLHPEDGSTASLARYFGCAGGADVLFYRMDGTGHSVPSKAAPDPGNWAASDARLNRDLETAEAVWAFFRDRRR